MATDPSEMLGFETKRDGREEVWPDLYSVPAGLEVISADLRRILPEVEVEDRRIDFLLEVIETLPPETIDIANQLCRSKVDAISKLGPVLLPEILRRAVYAEKFTHEELDELRQMWGEQMNHPGLEVRTAALQAFEREKSYLLEHDVTTFGMLNQVLEQRQSRPVAPLSAIHGVFDGNRAPRNSYSHDVANKLAGKPRFSHQYLRDSQGQIVGVIQ